MIKNVIFDLGGVFIEYRPKEYLESLGFSPERVEFLMKAVFRHPLWDEFDRGLYSIAEMQQIFTDITPEIAPDMPVIFHDKFFDVLTLMPETEVFLEELKKRGFGLYVLSNFSEEGITWIRRRYKFFELFDGMVVSYALKYIKPEKQIYEYLFNTYRLEPSECVFLDDKPINIEAARSLGMHGIVFNDINDVRKQFEELVANTK